MEDKIKTYVLDACALIAFLRAESGSDKLLKLFKDKKCRFFLHAINLGEVYYDTLRLSGKDKAIELFADIINLPIDIVWTLNMNLLKLAGKYKTTFSISYADSYVLALAENENGIVISTDHHEFDEIEKSGNLSFFWLL